MAKAAGLVCALLLLASFCCQSLAQRGSAAPEKCCFKFQKTKLKRDNIVSCYPISPVCPQPAVIGWVGRGLRQMGKEGIR
uniref:Chemokine interleukin-8-like domain-containing protein n=1 Tax=Chelonoidis abingdonii TaxID=106734 RepID=A0A8C0G9G3_CHEAB